jgi:hypothetical protein
VWEEVARNRECWSCDMVGRNKRGYVGKKEMESSGEGGGERWSKMVKVAEEERTQETMELGKRMEGRRCWGKGGRRTVEHTLRDSEGAGERVCRAGVVGARGVEGGRTAVGEAAGGGQAQAESVGRGAAAGAGCWAARG